MSLSKLAFIAIVVISASIIAPSLAEAEECNIWKWGLNLSANTSTRGLKNFSGQKTSTQVYELSSTWISCPKRGMPEARLEVGVGLVNFSVPRNIPVPYISKGPSKIVTFGFGALHNPPNSPFAIGALANMAVGAEITLLRYGMIVQLNLTDNHHIQVMYTPIVSLYTNMVEPGFTGEIVGVRLGASFF